MMKVNNKNTWTCVVLVFLSLTLNIFHTFSSVSIVDFEQIDVSCDWFLLLKSFFLKCSLVIWSNSLIFIGKFKSSIVFHNILLSVTFFTSILLKYSTSFFRKRLETWKSKIEKFVCMKKINKNGYQGLGMVEYDRTKTFRHTLKILLQLLQNFYMKLTSLRRYVIKG